MIYKYISKDTCSRQIKFDIDGDIIRNVEFTGGCNGNLQAIRRLVDGLTVEQIEDKCKGILCGQRPTSCTDQLAIAVREAFNSNKSAVNE